MSEPKDYLALVQEVEPLDIAKFGYYVHLYPKEEQRVGKQIGLTLFYQGEVVRESGVKLVNDNYHTKTFPTLIKEIRAKVLSMYDDHNAGIGNPDILKALESRLNQSPALDQEMLVLTRYDGVQAIEGSASKWSNEPKDAILDADW